MATGLTEKVLLEILHKGLEKREALMAISFKITKLLKEQNGIPYKSYSNWKQPQLPIESDSRSKMSKELDNQNLQQVIAT